MSISVPRGQVTQLWSGVSVQDRINGLLAPVAVQRDAIPWPVRGRVRSSVADAADHGVPPELGYGMALILTGMDGHSRIRSANFLFGIPRFPFVPTRLPAGVRRSHGATWDAH